MFALQIVQKSGPLQNANVTSVTLRLQAQDVISKTACTNLLPSRLRVTDRKLAGVHALQIEVNTQSMKDL